MIYQRLEMWAIVSMAIITLMRVPAAMRSPEQRRLWLAMAAATVSMSFHVHAVSEFVDGLVGVTRWTDLFRHLCGLITVGLILDLVVSTTDSRGSSRSVRRLVVGVALVLVALDVWVDSSARNNLLAAGLSDSPVTKAYWLILLSAHLAMNIAYLRTCWSHSGGVVEAHLRYALRLFGVGMLFSATYMTASMGYLFSRVDSLRAALPALGAGEAIFMAAGMAVPLLLAARATASKLVAFYRLHPLWRALLEAIPEMALADAAPRTPVGDLFSLHSGIHTPLYRQVIEIRDALLLLGRYVPPGVARQVEDHLRDNAVPENRWDASFTACAIRVALDARSAGMPAGNAGVPYFTHGGIDLAEEVRWLRLVAREREGSVAGAFRWAYRQPESLPKALFS